MAISAAINGRRARGAEEIEDVAGGTGVDGVAGVTGFAVGDCSMCSFDDSDMFERTTKVFYVGKKINVRKS